MVDSGAPIGYGFSPLCVTQKCWWRRVASSSKCRVNYEVAPVVRPIFSVDVLTSKGALVVFGVDGNSSFIQLLDGHQIPMISENGAMVHLLKAVKSICTADLIGAEGTCQESSISRTCRKEQYDWLRISTEPCFSTCRKGRGSRLIRFMQHQHGSLEIPFGFSTDISHTKEERQHSNVSQEVHTDLRFFRCSRWWSV